MTERPARRTTFKSRLGRFLLRVFGWHAEGIPMTSKKSVLIAAPHTTNWDLYFMLATAMALDISVAWVGKEAIFRFPFGGFFRRLGGISVTRGQGLNQVEQLVQHIRESENIHLAVAPAGTRGVGEYWKSGFYHIAQKASVPIYCGYLDYKLKRGGVGLALTVSGNVGHDMDQLRKFYGPIQGKYPHKTTPPKLKLEVGQDSE